MVCCQKAKDQKTVFLYTGQNIFQIIAQCFQKSFQLLVDYYIQDAQLKKIFIPVYNKMRILQLLVQIKPEYIIRVPQLIISFLLSWTSKEFNTLQKQIRTVSPKMQYIIVCTDTVTILTLKYTLESCTGHFCRRKVTGIQESSCDVPPHSHSQSIKEIMAYIHTGCAQRRASARSRSPEFKRRCRSDPHPNMKSHSSDLSKSDI